LTYDPLRGLPPPPSRGMPRARPYRAFLILTVLILAASLLLFCTPGNYYHELKLESHSRSPLQTELLGPDSEPEATVQPEPEAQIGSDIDPHHCVPSILSIEPSSERSNNAIPNIVHYVWLDAHDNFSIDFRHFISVYSASYYFNPEMIYIHTDASPNLWEEAKTSGKSMILHGRMRYPPSVN